MRHILFVDDEVPILDGLRGRLHRMAQRWEMTFAESGARALQELEARPYDVIVSDMRMPSMDGAQLLRIVNERWPQTIRIVLSGFSEIQQTMRLVPIAHQFLSKPCQPTELENVIERCLKLQEVLKEPALRAVVGRVRRLPAVPRTFARLQSAMANEAVTCHEIGDIVAADPTVAAKFLQLANSAFFRLSRRITNIEQAVTHLGFAAARNLVLSAEVFSGWSGKSSHAAVDLERLQQHSQRIAEIAGALTARTPIADEAILAALVHDIGYWVLIQECPRELEQSLTLALDRGIALHEAELQVIGSTHAEIGAYLLGIWGLPYSVVEAVAHHHAPTRVTQSGFDVLAALAVAVALAVGDETAPFHRSLIPDDPVGAGYLESLGAPFDWTEAQCRAGLFDTREAKS
jgi:HD-like signal output (HDOD) protein